MSKALEITEQDIQPVAMVPSSPDPMAMIQRAVELNLDIDKLEKLMALQERWQANEARKAFQDDMAAFKTEPLIITKDKENKQYGSWYTSIGNMVGTVNPVLAKHNLSASWEVDQSSGVRITCTLTHRLGHTKNCTVTFPPDKSGSKNVLQEIKSAITYGKVSTFEAVCGLASSDDPGDNDGNGAGTRQGLASETVTEFTDHMRDSSTREELQRRFQEAYKAASAANDKRSGDLFIALKDELRRGLR